MDQPGTFLERFARVEDRREGLILDGNVPARLARGIDRIGRDGNDRFALIANDIARQDPLVLHVQPKPVLQIGAGENGANAGHFVGLGSVDRDNTRRRMR